ncbi:MAG: hypothetical protein CML60_10340 [Rhodobacteraceae bacterium]|nr:hypothetical protein [Paracoccaceae bacterium]
MVKQLLLVIQHSGITIVRVLDVLTYRLLRYILLMDQQTLVRSYMLKVLLVKMEVLLLQYSILIT